MTRDELIEELTDRACPGRGDPLRIVAEAFARTNITHLCEVIPGLSDIIDGKAVIMPVEPDEDCLGPGVYAVADRLCASEYVNGPDASVVLALAHQVFLDGFNAMLAASPYRSANNDPR